VQVTYDISLTNLETEVLADTFTLFLKNSSPDNITAEEAGSRLPLEVTVGANGTIVEVTFPEPLAGVNKTRRFQVRFSDRGIATKTGDVWDVLVPEISSIDMFDDFTLVLEVPKAYGKEVAVSPEPATRDDSGNYTYSFAKQALRHGGVSAAYGEFQVQFFNFNYLLPQDGKLALPPDTPFQKIMYVDIAPSPLRIETDEVGNWIGHFDPSSGQSVKVSGAAQLFTAPRRDLPKKEEDLDMYLLPTGVWQTGDELIQTYAATRTLSELYEEVAELLSFDESPVRPGPPRYGAVGALAQPDRARSLEYTDLFVALARASGSPARATVGYAEPPEGTRGVLSLSKGNLHAWAEYYSAETETWELIDPMWRVFTRDLRRITLFTDAHGDYSRIPLVTKASVFTGSLPEDRNERIALEMVGARTLPFFDGAVDIVVKNVGSVAVYNEEVDVLFDDQKELTLPITSLPPFSEKRVRVSVPIGFLGREMPSEIAATHKEQRVTLYSGKQTVIIGQLVTYSSATLSFMVLSFLGFRRVLK